MAIETVFVVGAAHVGKDTFARALAQALNGFGSDVLTRKWTIGNTGDVLLDILARVKAAERGVRIPRADPDIWRRLIEADKDRYRPCLVQLGDALREVWPGQLVDRCVRAGHRIIVGARQRRELSAYSDCHDVLVCHVSRPEWKSPEDGFELDVPALLKLFPAERLLLIENKYGLPDLEQVARWVADRVKEQQVLSSEC